MTLFDWKCSGCGLLYEDFIQPNFDHLDPNLFNPNEDPGLLDYCFGQFERQISSSGAFIFS